MTIQPEAFIDLSTPTGPMRTYFFAPATPGQYPALIFYSEIFQLTGPIRRTAALLAGHGYIVAVPEVYHELESPGTVLAYDQAGADKGNFNKFEKQVSAYDSDARTLINHLTSLSNCNGKLGVIGICLGGHLAFRAAMNLEVSSTACFYPTDIHSSTLGNGRNDNSLLRAPEIQGELLMIFGRQDPHIPLDGRNKIRARLEEANLNYTWHEVNAAHAFIRDEGPRYDPVLALQCLNLALELFQRKL